MMSPRRPVFLVMAAWLAVIPIGLAGCYDHVVEADEAYDGPVYEPNVEEPRTIERVDDDQDKIERVDDMN